MPTMHVSLPSVLTFLVTVKVKPVVSFLPQDTMLAWYTQQSSVCQSMTSRCPTEMIKHRITQTMPHDSAGTR